MLDVALMTHFVACAGAVACEPQRLHAHRKLQDAAAEAAAGGSSADASAAASAGSGIVNATCNLKADN